MAETNSGVWLDRTLRTGACGTWWSASAAGGHPLGLLQLEPTLLAEPAARDRVAAAVAAVRTLNPSGVLRTTELVVDTRRAWLVVASVPTPTLADLLAAGPTLGPGAAAGIALDVAHALRDLHAAGLSHGDLSTATVVLSSAGVATLIEVGVLTAIQGAPTDVGRDAFAWAAMVRELAGAANASEAELLDQAAATAESGDLATAARRLAARTAELSDFASRESLAAVLPTVVPGPARIPAPRSTMESTSTVRVRFGRGVPDSALSGAPISAVTPPQARRRSIRRIQVAALVVLLLLGAGAALWWLLLLN